ncbi:MAG: hypothetical protein FGM28_06025 [Limnohabitans sp.]|nr:hypothetical protein [Limnohabitans sp.]
MSYFWASIFAQALKTLCIPKGQRQIQPYSKRPQMNGFCLSTLLQDCERKNGYEKPKLMESIDSKFPIELEDSISAFKIIATTDATGEFHIAE